MSKRGHEVLVIAPSQSGKPHKEVDENYTIARTAALPFPFYQNFRISVSPYTEVKKIVTDFKPDVIHVQSPLGIGRAALNVGKKYGIPVVATNHSMPENLIDNLRLLAPFSKPINYVIKEYFERFYGNADYVTLPTKAAIKMFDDMPDITVPLKAVSNGIDLSRFKPQRVDAKFKKRFNIPTGKPIVMYLGRLDAEKHISTLVKAAHRVMQKMDVHLLIVGSGTDLDNLKGLVDKMQISDKVTFTGRIEDSDLPIMQNCGDVFGMPSPVELQCISMLEAMASGQPTVAVNVGAVHELCQDGRNGFLSQVDDDEKMADDILKILLDKDLQKKMGKESLKIAKTHDITYTFKEFESIYKDVIKKYIPEGDQDNPF
jgi:glycosyltransferase involved in cell wall biosynthesis